MTEDDPPRAPPESITSRGQKHEVAMDSIRYMTVKPHKDEEIPSNAEILHAVEDTEGGYWLRVWYRVPSWVDS